MQNLKLLFWIKGVYGRRKKHTSHSLSDMSSLCMVCIFLVFIKCRKRKLLRQVTFSRAQSLDKTVCSQEQHTMSIARICFRCVGPELPWFPGCHVAIHSRVVRGSRSNSRNGDHVLEVHSEKQEVTKNWYIVDSYACRCKNASLCEHLQLWW